MDVTLPNEQWTVLTGYTDGEGILCGACIIQRAVGKYIVARLRFEWRVHDAGEAGVQLVKGPGEFAGAMVLIYQGDDIEARHQEAVRLMLKLLRSLGYDGGVTVFENMEKRYD
jgi:hypothetical protein